MIHLLRRAFARVAAMFSRKRLDADLAAELGSHLDLAIEDNRKLGMSPEKARRRALAAIGGVTQAAEIHRDARTLPVFDILGRDFRYALRSLRRDRGFTAVAIAILALGIGSNAAVFSVIDALLLRPLPFRDPQQLTWLAGNQGEGGLSAVTYTVSVYEAFRDHNRSFQGVTAYNPFYGGSDYKLTGRGEPQQVAGVLVAGNFFPVLGVQPILGRVFTPDECRAGGRPAVLLSYFFWQRQFSGDRSILGQAILLNNHPYTVVGVLPRSFDFGSVFSPGTRMDVFVPAVLDQMRTWGNTLAMVGRLQPGATVQQAQAEADVLLPQLKAAHPEWWYVYTARITGLRNYISGKLRRSLIVLWSAVGVILLIVCVNLANLLLSRGMAREKEFAMRGALGAARSRIVVQLLAESLVLSGMGTLGGLAIAYGIAGYLARQHSIALPLLGTVGIDGAALGWTVLVGLASTLLFGLAPAWNVSRTNLQAALKDSGAGVSSGRRHDRIRAALVISEVALACVLLAGAGLLLRSFLRVLDVDLGFQPSHAAAMTIDYDDGGKMERRAAVLQEILRRVSAVPGVEAAGVSDMLPLGRNRSWGLRAKGRTYRPGEEDAALVRIVTPGYLQAMGIRLQEGRDFTWNDSPSSEKVVIINAAAARYNWPGQDALGRIAHYNDTDARVVGILPDLPQNTLEESVGPEMYIPAMQSYPEGAELVVRTRLDPAALAGSVMRALREYNLEQPASEFRPIQSIVDHAVSPRRFFVVLVGIFAAIGLILASLGIYGVTAYSVSRQKQEIGIRMALGATARVVQRDVLARTARLAVVGIALGAGVSWAAARFIASLLYKTEPTDPATFAAAIFLLGLVALLAAYLPARRASRIDPMVALRDQ